MTVPAAWFYWLFPLVFLIHDAEEILLVERWLARHGPVLIQRFGRYRLARIILERAQGTTTARFSTMVAAIFIGVCTASYLGAKGQTAWFAAGVLLLFANVLTHAGQALFAWSYTPGLVTAVAVALPYCLYAYGSLVAAGFFQWSLLWAAAPVALIVLVLAFLAGYLAGRRLSPRKRSSSTSVSGPVSATERASFPTEQVAK